MLRRQALLLAVPVLLGACGFRPLLKATESADVREQLAAIQVTGLSGRLGQLARNALLEELNPRSLDVPPRYRLAVRLRRASSALAIQLDNTITRYNLTLTAPFQLIDRANNEVVYRSSVRRIASYNVRRAPFATLVAEQDAERRAIEELATNIRNILAVHFAREAGPA